MESKRVDSKAPSTRTVCLIFRKPVPHFFSIEKIFFKVSELLGNEINFRKAILPFYTSSFSNVIKNIRAARKEKADIFHVTGDAHYAVLAYSGSKSILTVHDCGFMEQTSGIKRWIMNRLLLKWPVNHCSIVTTISEQTRNDIIKYTGCSPEKIVVIQNPVVAGLLYQEKAFNKTCPVLLFIGSTPNKNLNRVIEAVKGLHCILDIVGIISAEQHRELENNKIHFRESSKLTDNELAKKYAECDLVLFPSTFEGFGLPIIEAQQTGRAVITSNISPMKEVAGEGACLVDPFSVQSIRDGILQVIRDDDHRSSMISKGVINAQRFNPEKIAREYFKVYQKVYSGKSSDH